jgi:hypothetical protein
VASRRSRKYKTLGNYLESLNIDARELRNRNSYTGVGSEAISASQLSEEVEILDKAIQSSNYLSGENGWRIDGSGNAEFGNVFVRGDINAETGTIGYWNISSPTVTRTFQDFELKGTFLESYNHGSSDSNTGAGSYVSLYKSYEDDSIIFTGFSVESNRVTITANAHQFTANDLVVVSFANTTYSTYSKSIYSPGTITNTTDNTFTYSIGTKNETGVADVAFTAESGEAYIYVPDVAGLYLRDYELKNFNYGYFSNKGVRYSSPDAVNFIYNPSFESGVIANNASVSNAGSWSNSNVSSATFSKANIATLTATRTGSYTGQFARTSNFAANVRWSTTAPIDNKLVSTIDYSSIIYYNKIYSGTKLYLNMDIFFDYQPSIAAAKNVSSATYSTNGNLAITMGAAVAGYFSAGDYVFLDVEGKDGDVDMFSRVAANTTITTPSVAFERICRVITTSGSVLYVDLGPDPYDEGATGTVTLSSRTNHDGTARPRRVHKVIYPQYNLSEITFNLGGTATTSLANVLVDSSVDAWADGYNKYYTVSDPSQYMDYLVDTSNATNVGPIITSLTPASNVESDGVIIVDGKKLYDEYYRLNPTGLANQNAISIQYPTWFYQGNLSDTSSTGVKITANTALVGTVAAYFDNFNFGSFPSGFYGDTKNQSGSYAWANSISAPNTISYASGTEWINIDVDTQDVLYDGIDYLGFSNQDFPHALKKRAAVTTYLGTSPTAFTAGGGGAVATGAIAPPGSFAGTQRLPYYGKNAGKAVDIGLFPSDSYYMRFDGGVLRTLDADALTSNVKYLEYNSYINTILSQTSTGVEIAAKKIRVTYDPTTDTDTTDTANSISASIIAYVTPEDRGKVIVKGQMVLEGTRDVASISSTNHPFQIGMDSGSNLRFSTYTLTGSAYSVIQAINNGTYTRLYINSDGGNLHLASGSNNDNIYLGSSSTNKIDVGGGNGTGGPTTTFGGLLSSDSTYSNDITATRRAMWIQSNGTFGYASSSRTKKQDIVSANLDVSSILSIDPVKFKYIKAVEESGSAAEIEVGFIAEDLHDAGLTEFVDYGKSGEPEGIHYQTYVVALQAVVRSQQQQIDDLKVRLENGGL